MELTTHTDLPKGSSNDSEANACLTDDVIFAESVSEEDVSMEMFETDSDILSSVVDRLTDTADAEVGVVKPVGPVIPLSLLDDTEIPEGSGMSRLETGGVSPVDALEWMSIKGLPTLSVDEAAVTLYSSAAESVVSIRSGIGFRSCSGKASATDDTFEVDEGVLLIVLLTDVVLDALEREPSRGTHRPSLPLPRASSMALAAAWSWVKGRPLPVAQSPFTHPSFLQPSVN